jgi:hypothetical protein
MDHITSPLLLLALLLCIAPIAAAAEQSASSGGKLIAEKKDGGITVRAGDREILRYRGEPGGMPADFEPAYLRGGYIAAVYTPSGALVSDDYPPAHKHHHGIWSPWTKAKFEGRDVDFWNMGQKKGTVQPVSFGDISTKDGAVSFRAKHRMVDLTAPDGPKPAIDEQWDVTVYAPKSDSTGKPVNVFDLVITQTCASDSPLELPKYHYGGLGFRGRRNWDGAGNCKFLTSEGVTDRVKANETRAKWAHVGGDADGKPVGIAVLCHPDDFRFPQPIRTHPTEPFLCYAPSQLGDWKIEPGKPYVAKYRFVVTDGEPDAKEIDAMWQAYAKQK